MPPKSWVASHPGGIAIKRDIEAYAVDQKGNLDNMPRPSFWYVKYDHLFDEIKKVKPNYRDNVRSFIKRLKDDIIISKSLFEDLIYFVSILIFFRRFTW